VSCTTVIVGALSTGSGVALLVTRRDTKRRRMLVRRVLGSCYEQHLIRGAIYPVNLVSGNEKPSQQNLFKRDLHLK